MRKLNNRFPTRPRVNQPRGDICDNTDQSRAQPSKAIATHPTPVAVVRADLAAV